MPGAELLVRLTTAAAVTLELGLHGEWRWDQPERVYREAAEPPELESVRYAWDVRGGAILTPDGSTGGGWTAFRAALAVLDSRSDPVVKVEILRLEAGVETSEITLGPPDYEGFRIDRVSGDEPYELDPKATHLRAWPITLRFSALKVFERDIVTPDGTVEDVVGFEQTVSQEYDEAALGTITWDTTVTTRAGVDARAKAISLGRIPIPGVTWAYETNGDALGVNLELLDALDAASTPRVVTKVRALSRVVQYGVRIGTTGPGSHPGRVALVDQRDDDGREVVRTVQAQASGPGAEAWVRSQAPGGATEEVTRHDQARRGFSAQWTVRTPKSTVAIVTIVGEVTGGFQDFDYEPVPGGLAPARFDGAILPWQLTLSVRVMLRGGGGTKAELPLPPLLRSPWSLDRKASAEGFPAQQEETATVTAAAARWVREARLVYRASEPPSEDPVEWLRANAAKAVPSYWLQK